MTLPLLSCPRTVFSGSVVAAATLYPVSLMSSSSALVRKHSCSRTALGLLSRQFPTSSKYLFNSSLDVFRPPQLKEIAKKSGFICFALDSKPIDHQLSDRVSSEVWSWSFLAAGVWFGSVCVLSFIFWVSAIAIVVMSFSAESASLMKFGIVLPTTSVASIYLVYAWP